MVQSDSLSAPLGGPTLKERFLAWWDGYHLTAKRQREAAATLTTAPVDTNLARTGKPIWTATRIQVAEKLWGEGFTGPGAGSLIPDLIGSLGLSSTKTVLDLSAGLGGADGLMAADKGCWVDGLEANPVLAAIGRERLAKAGLAKKASIKEFDPETFDWPKKVDVVFARESFFTVANKQALIERAAGLLKPGGQMLFTDFTLEEGAELGQWDIAEPLEPHPWTGWNYVQALRRAKLDVRIVADITDEYRLLITAALKPFSEHLRIHDLDQETLAAVQAEVSLWGGRVAAFAKGLRVHRIHAVRHR